MLNKLIFILLLAVPFRLFPAEPKGRDTIPQYSYGTIQEFWSQMDDIFNDPNFINANWGVLIQSLQTGEYFYKRSNCYFMLGDVANAKADANMAIQKGYFVPDSYKSVLKL